MYLLSTAGSNRPGDLDPSRSPSILAAAFCWVAATLPSSLAGCGWPILGRAQRPKEVKNCGQPQPQAEATSYVSACKPTEACRRAKPALWRKEECTGKDRVVLARSDPDSTRQ
jgi:hypothetical protein